MSEEYSDQLSLTNTVKISLLQKAVSSAPHLKVVQTQTNTLSRFIISNGEIVFVGYLKLLLSAAKNYDVKNGSNMHLQNRRANTHRFHDSDYNDNFKPFNIDTDVDTILINAARTQASAFQISIDGHAIWRQIPNEDRTRPDDTVSGLADLMSPSSGGCNCNTFSRTCNTTSTCKAHFS
jgi:hypothetical protein